MRKIIVFSFMICATFILNAQKIFTKTANVSFNASSPLEPIEGTTRTASTVIDLTNGNMEFAVLVKSFLFPQALMQEHFNENYMESNKFPKATFKGKIENLKDINFTKDGTYKAKVSGNLEMHGITKPVSTTADFVIKGGKIKATSNFSVTIADYGIAIPSAVKDKIAKTAKISIVAEYQPLK